MSGHRLVRGAGRRVGPSGRRPALLRSSAALVVGSLVAATVWLVDSDGTTAVARADDSGSQMTVAGTGPYADLKVTLNQSRDLINQVVSLSWSGGRPTTPAGSFGAGFLQVMQCWADVGELPDREQCQFGASPGDSRAAGSFLSSRQVSYDNTLIDPLETYLRPGENQQSYVPFRSVTGDLAGVNSATNEFYDASSSNELAFGRTRANGTGSELLEVQTLREAPGLGCGAPTAGPGGATVGRACFLVVVPRGTVEIDGTSRTGDLSTISRLASSPLSQSNWRHRIVLPLEFLPVGGVCPLGSAERRTVGQELVSEVITRWQPVLCADDGAVYGFSRVPDGVGRNQLVSGDPGLVFLSRPLALDEQPSAGRARYAPVALSGLSIAFNLDSRSRRGAPDPVVATDGTRIEQLKLTPRLVAKLLTQSYRLASPVGRNPDTQNNPDNLTKDPEFLALNPGFTDLAYSGGLADLLVPAGQAESTRRVWAWLLSDPEAAAFLSGAADGFGMKLNPAYLGQQLPREDFPKADPFCTVLSEGQPDLCTLDQSPYAGDLFEAGRAASRGDSLARTIFDPTGVPPGYRKNPPQPTGLRQLLALVDTATADRFGLPSASLRNASGGFVAPDQAGLLAGLAASRPGAVAEVVEPVPGSADPAAYPLTSLTYAATVPEALAPEAATDFAALLRYAAGPGQVPGVSPGTLPGGYVPLPQELRTQTLSVAAALETAAVPSAPSASPSPAAVGPPVVPPPAAAPAAPPPVAQAPIAATPPVSAPAPQVAQVPLPVTADVPPPTQPVIPLAQPAAGPAAVPIVLSDGAPLAGGTTPVAPVGGGRFALVAALGLGGLAAAGSALLRRVTGRTGA